MTAIDEVARQIEIAFVEKTMHHPVSKLLPRMAWIWPIVAKAAIVSLREPAHAITRAMAESRATDDEGQFEPLMDLIDFSGENKTHTVLAQTWRDGIDAILKDAE